MTRSIKKASHHSNKNNLRGLQQAISYFGTQTELAKNLGLDKSIVTHWVKRRRNITAETAIEIESITNQTVLRENLRPDLFIR